MMSRKIYSAIALPLEAVLYSSAANTCKMPRLCSLLIILAVVTSSCNHNYFAAAKGDTCDETSTCEPSEIHVGDDNMSSTWEFMSAFSKLGTSWNHVIGECELRTYM